MAAPPDLDRHTKRGSAGPAYLATAPLGIRPADDSQARHSPATEFTIGSSHQPWSFGHGSSDVHVWTARLPFRDDVVGALLDLLSHAERTRAWGFRFSRDRVRFVCCRGLLRMLIGQYMRQAPESIRLVEGPHGKPELASGFGRLDFNLSHAQDVAVIAFAREMALGIDIESLRSVPDALGIAAAAFAPAETARLHAVGGSARDLLFLELWTRREAELKAEGVGLVGRAGSVLRPEGGWRLHVLSPAPEHIAALATSADLDRLQLRNVDLKYEAGPGAGLRGLIE